MPKPIVTQEPLIFKPQKGFQVKALGCTADIAFIGGQAGGGKTTVLVAEPLKWVHAPDFAAVFFRRTMERIRATGGVLSETKKWYLEATLSETILKWRFPSGAQVDFEGIEHIKDLEKWHGTQIPLMVFDEVTEFEEEMFWFMISRNRGIVKWREEDGNMYSMKPYVRASCNPKPNSWVSRLLEWYIDQETGFPIDERDAVLRYMINHKGKICWGDSKQQVIDENPEVFEMMEKIDPSIKKEDLIKSFTFIRGKLSDNKILTKNSPEYYSSLLSMDEADQKRFLEGNWKIAEDNLDLFKLDDNFFKGVPPTQPIPNKRYIVCDAAKFGQDLCTIYVFEEWTVIHITVFHLSDARDIFDEIESLRRFFLVARLNTIIDQDGLGGDVVKLGRYLGFIARKKPAIDQTTRQVENYATFKDQCFFHAAEKVNNGECRMIITNQSVKIFDRGTKNARWSTKIKCSGNLAKKYGDGMTDVRIIITDQLRAIRKADTVYEGGESKYSINDKDEQKIILSGISPDFADPIGMRASFDLEKRRKGINKMH